MTVGKAAPGPGCMWHEPTPSFVPHPLFAGPHRQTIAGAYLWRRPADSGVRRWVELDDGDRLVVHDDRGEGWRPGDRAVLLVHGLAGSHSSGYMLRAARKLNQVGCRTFRLDLRGCGAGMMTARRPLHAARVDDIVAAVRQVAQWTSDSPLTLVGFSLGASMVLKLLGNVRALPESIHSAIAVCPPLDILACSRKLREGWNRIYDASFVRALRRQLKLRRERVPGFVDADWTSPPSSLYDFDRLYTAPNGGFAGVEDYYQQASSLPQLSRISVPTRILFSEDDPLVPSDVFRRAEYSPTTRVYPTRYGGHLGFLARPAANSPDPDWHWLDWRIVDWVTKPDSP
ncbi:MAG: alpha/beta fold hydrolase [Pirellulales bacterium]